jgi:hypothetical protein
MINPWWRSLRSRAENGSPQDRASSFSLRRLADQNPALADHYLWATNRMPAVEGQPFLHLGCGERVLDGFVNLDFIPHDDRVLKWNFLDLWPDSMDETAEGVFSEDLLEHFFYAEQAYILCNINRVLRSGKVARTLMPSLPRLIDYCAGYKPDASEFLHQTFGIETGADALNIGLRFSGHRWLHSPQSLQQLAAMCGFDVLETSCATSTVEQFSGINLRDETNSLSFASDLRKMRSITRVELSPQSIAGASPVEDAIEGVPLFVATADRPSVTYAFREAIGADAVACINFRSSNLSSFSEHNLKSLVIDGLHPDKPWFFDETLKSRPCMNLITRNQLPLIATGSETITTFSFSPAARQGEYFTLGCAEIFSLA